MLELPVSAGDWLRCYRLRRKRNDGRPFIPEDFGRELGVSGQTLRRWESGTSRPREQDLECFSELTGLSALEREFLKSLFLGSNHEVPPSEATFRASACTLLACEFPAFMVDSLFYVRAWNSYASGLFGHFLGQATRVNVVEAAFLVHQALQEFETHAHRMNRWLLEFWLSTARLSGAPAYGQLVHRLLDIEEFRGLWRSLATEQMVADAAPLQSPYHFGSPSLGDYRVYSSHITLPPAYVVREYVPVDKRAMQSLDVARAKTPPEVFFADSHHWSLDQALD